MKREVVPRVLEVLPALLAVVTFALLSGREAGYDPTTWYPAALFLLFALLATGLALARRPPELPRLTLIALGLLAAFTVWSFVSILWADVPADAWEGADRSLLYLVVFALFSLSSWRPSTAAAVFGLYSLLLAVVAIATLARLTDAADPAQFFIDGRLAEPAGYQNATAALLIGGMWPALVLSARRETPWPLRGILLAAAGLFIQLALLPQSRGATIVLPLALLILIVLVPQRLRVLLAMALVAVASLISGPAILEVYDVVGAGGDAATAIDEAVSAIAISCAALLVAGTGLALIDRRYQAPERARTVAARSVLAVAVVAALAGSVAAVAAIGNPVDWADERWADFKGGYDDDFEASRFSGDIGSNRYDFWSVGLGTSFADAPLQGQGADNFAVDYLRERHSSEEPRYPHSLPVRILAGTGLIGGLLFFGFLATGVAAAIRSLRCEPSGLGKAVAATALAAFAYWAMHSSGDWLFSFPAVTAPAIGWLAMAGTLQARSRLDRGRAARSSDMRTRLTAAIGLLVAVIAAAALAAPWISAEYSEQALSVASEDPEAAYEWFERAESANPLSARPAILAGSLAVREANPEVAAERFEAALEREPDNWYALLMLGALKAEAGESAKGKALISAALAANPADPLIRDVNRRVLEGGSVFFRDIEEELISRVCDRVGISGAERCS